jgi:hypothetical protein
MAETIDVSHVPYDESEVDAWREARERFSTSQTRDFAELGRFAELAQERRIICFEEAVRHHGFAEARIALGLAAEGYRCWTGVQFFPLLGRTVRTPPRKRNTDEVAREFAERGILWPKLLQPRLREWEHANGQRVRNPDLVCLHPETRKWLFIEVKRGSREKASPGQLAGIVILKWLTGGDAQVRRLMSRRSEVGDDPTPRAFAVMLGADYRG